MPHVGPVSEGRNFFCPHCGALYAETRLRQDKSDNNIASERARYLFRHATITCANLVYNQKLYLMI
jgi:hypothetical protein